MEKFIRLSFILGFLFSSSAAFAAINLKPGLWEIQSTFKTGDKQMDPQAEVQKALAKMPAAQRKQMEAMMKSHGATMGDKGFKVCYTTEFLNRDDALTSNKAFDQCQSTVKSRTSSKIVIDFKCKDGATGTSDWNILDPNHYRGHVNMTDSKGVKSEIDFKGAYASASCGSVKPFEIPKKN